MGELGAIVFGFFFGLVGGDGGGFVVYDSVDGLVVLVQYYDRVASVMDGLVSGLGCVKMAG